MESNEQHLFDLQIDRPVATNLREAAKWGKFLGIMGFIFCGLLVIIGFFAGTIFSRAFSQMGGDMKMGMGSFMTIIYILIAILYFFPCLYLFNFSTKMQRALQENDQGSLADSFKNLKSCFKFLGIMTIVILAFYVLAIIVAIAGASFG